MKRKLLLVFTYIAMGLVGFAQTAPEVEVTKSAPQSSPFNRAADNEDKKIDVYPNPSTGMVNLTLTGFRGKKTELQVVNVIGSIIYREVLSDNETSKKVLDLTKEPSGLYYIKIQSDGYSEIRKIIIN
ncbi:MAG: T9SS type A sorting domain-containing protein [Adhaeribacter sp.]